MNHYEIIWQQPDGLTRDLWVYAKSVKAARQPIEEVLEEGDRILSCKKRELTTTKGEPTRLSTTEAARLLDMTKLNPPQAPRFQPPGIRRIYSGRL